MTEPEWLDQSVVVEIHEQNLVRFGGSAGIRDLGLLESALARPRWSFEFDSNTNLYRLAAAYAFGIARNHPFVDGNKRVGFLSAYTFLRYNGQHLIAAQRDAERTMLALAAGDIGEAEFAQWLERHSEPTNRAN